MLKELLQTQPEPVFHISGKFNLSNGESIELGAHYIIDSAALKSNPFPRLVTVPFLNAEEKISIIFDNLTQENLDHVLSSSLMQHLQKSLQYLEKSLPLAPKDIDIYLKNHEEPYITPYGTLDSALTYTSKIPSYKKSL